MISYGACKAGQQTPSFDITMLRNHPLTRNIMCFVVFAALLPAVHHLVGSLSQGGLPGKASVVGILPITIDTPANRAAFGDKADYSSWTTPEVIAQQLLVWSQVRHHDRTVLLFTRKVTALWCRIICDSYNVLSSCASLNTPVPCACAGSTTSHVRWSLHLPHQELRNISNAEYSIGSAQCQCRSRGSSCRTMRSL